MSREWWLSARLLALASLTIACGPSWPRQRDATCDFDGVPRYREGYLRVVHRPALRQTGGGKGEERGTIATLMTQANSRQTGVLRGGVVRIFQGGRTATGIIRRSNVDENGRAVFDTLPPGWYYVEGLAIGFSRLGDSVQVRAGYQNTIELQMRTDILCLSDVWIRPT